MRMLFSGLLLAGMAFGAVHPTSAATVAVQVTPACTDFTSANGTSGFPGTYIGTVGIGAGQTCQVGNIAANNVSGTGTFVNNDHQTSIYSFYWGGGALTVTEKLGNNGTGDAVDVLIGALASQTSTSLSSPPINSIVIPFTSGPSVAYTVLSNAALKPGYYAIETSLAGHDDPTFQINFTSTPEPASLALVLGGLIGATLVRRQRNAPA